MAEEARAAGGWRRREAIGEPDLLSFVDNRKSFI
jgi:hypothetical protein